MILGEALIITVSVEVKKSEFTKLNLELEKI